MTNHERAKIEDEAATWAVLLAEEPDSIDQLRQFWAWFKTSTLHAEIWARTRRAYVGLGQLLPSTQTQWPVIASGESRKDQAVRESVNGNDYHL